MHIRKVVFNDNGDEWSYKDVLHLARFYKDYHDVFCSGDSDSYALNTLNNVISALLYHEDTPDFIRVLKKGAWDPAQYDGQFGRLTDILDAVQNRNMITFV